MNPDSFITGKLDNSGDQLRNFPPEKWEETGAESVISENPRAGLAEIALDFFQR